MIGLNATLAHRFLNSRLRAGVVALLVMAACAAVRVEAQVEAQAEVASEQLPVIAPTFQPVFYGSDGVLSVVFAPDKPALYVHSHAATVNLWPNLVALWPELLGGLVAVCTLAILMTAWRLRCRRRKVGSPYCRRCNYDLTGQVRAGEENKAKSFAWDAGTKCPECGALLDRVRPVIGRFFLRRLAPALAVWACVVLAYAAMFAFRLPRTGAASVWFDWSSAWAAEHADSWALKWLSPRKGDSDRVVEIDPATGMLVRMITTRSSMTWFSLTVSPDGSALFLARGNEELDAVSVRSGRVMNSAVLPGSPVVDQPAPSVIGFTPDGSGAYVQWWNEDRNKSGVVCWPWREGGPVAPIVDVDGFADSVPGDFVSHWPRIFVARDHHGAVGAARFLSIPNFMELFPTKKFVLMLHDGSSAPRRVDVKPLPDGAHSPALSADGSTLFLLSGRGASMVGVDLDSGETIDTLSCGGPGATGDVVRSKHGRYLAFGGAKGILVRDTVEKKWAVRLALPPSLVAFRHVISPDGRWIAAVCVVGSGPQLKPSLPALRVVIWDLGEHRLVEEDGAAGVK